MQDLAGCDNNRTPVKFQGYDIYRFVGDVGLNTHLCCELRAV
jgi:hypothetical protein